MKEDIFISLSLANLCFINLWGELQNRSWNYYRKIPPPPSLVIGLLLDVLLLAAVFLTGRLLAARFGRRGLSVAHWGVLAALLLPLNILRNQFALTLWPANYRSLAAYLPVLLIAAVAVAWFRRRAACLRVISAGLLLLFPLLPLSVIMASWALYIKTPRSVFADKPLAAAVAYNNPSAPRIVWIVFDELDEYLTFVARPANVACPELDRLRAESFYATKAYAPTRNTQSSMPSLLTGRILTIARTRGPDELLVSAGAPQTPVNLSTLPNAFSDARSAGLNTGLVGSYQPYCRLLNESLTYCWWHASAVMLREEYARDPGIPRMMWLEFQRQLTRVPLVKRLQMIDLLQSARHLHAAEYDGIRDTAVPTAANPQLGFVLLHWPVPHPTNIFDASGDRVITGESCDYLSNLELADASLARMRSAMEKSGVWDRSIVLVTSDHQFRSSMWRRLHTWSPALEQATAGGQEHLEIPFLLHFPGQTHSFKYDGVFNTVLTRTLLAALERRELTIARPGIQMAGQPLRRLPRSCSPSG